VRELSSYTYVEIIYLQQSKLVWHILNALSPNVIKRSVRVFFLRVLYTHDEHVQVSTDTDCS